MKEFLRPTGRTKRIQTIVALLFFLLPLLGAISLLRQRDSIWQSSGLQGINVRDLALGVQDDQTILYATSDEGIFRSVDGAPWQMINTGLPLTLWGGITISELVVDPHNPALAYALVSDGRGLKLYRTTDSGSSWQRLPLPSDGLIFDALALFPGQSHTLYVLGSHGVYLSRDGGQNWVWRGIIPQGIQPQLLEVDPQSSSTLYLGTQGHGVFRSDDGGRSWQASNVGLGDQTIQQLLVSPVTHRVLFALADQGVYRSVDAGKSWQFVGQSLEGQEITIIAAHPSRPGVVYLGTAEGQVLVTADAGDTWRPLGTRLGDELVWALVPDQDSVRVATNSGLWQFNLDLPPDLTPPSTIVAMAPTETPTGTPRPSATPTATATPTQAPTFTPLPTATATPTPSPTPRPSDTSTPPPPPPATATQTPTPSATPPPPPTDTPLPPPPPTATPTLRPTLAPPTDTATPTLTPSPTATPSPTPTPLITPGGGRPTPPAGTPPPTVTPTSSPAPTLTLTPTLTPTVSATPTLTPTLTLTPTSAPNGEQPTPPGDTPSPTAVPTSNPLPTPTATPTLTPTASATATNVPDDEQPTLPGDTLPPPTATPTITPPVIITPSTEA